MPAAEITAGITSLRAAIDVAKAMVAQRDAKLLAAGANEIKGLLADAFDKLLEAREAQSTQLDQIQALKAQVAKFEEWATEKENYELKAIGTGVFAYMNKPAARGTEPPHWLCPNCFSKGQKAFFQFSTQMSGRGSVYRCKGCDGHMTTENEPEWL